MKILLFIDYLTSGGAQRQILGLAKLLQEKKYEVELLTYYEPVFYEDFILNNSIKHTCLLGISNPLLRIIKITSYIKKLQPDVVISYLDTPSIIACIAKALLRNFRLIVSSRNTTQKQSLYSKVLFFLYRYADAIVPNSISQELFLKNYCYKSRNKIRTIANYVDVDFFKPDYNFNSSSSVKKILTVARIANQKNVLRYIESIYKVKQNGYRFEIHWFGASTNRKYYKQCLDLLDSLKLNDTFFFHEPNMEIKDEYLGCDCFCLPSIYEGFPNVICEAMSCGKFILCGNVCDNSILVNTPDNGFLFDPYNVADMSQTICNFLDLTESEIRIVEKNNREYAERELSAEKFVNKYVDLINSL